MNEILQLLKEYGPSKSSFLAELLVNKFGLTQQNARQKLSRASGIIKKFPIQLLPNRESFIYLLEQRNTEIFWDNFLDALRSTNSIYGMTIDSLIAKGCIVSKNEFDVICGAPIAMKRQVSSSQVLKKLQAAGIVGLEMLDDEEFIVVKAPSLGIPDFKGLKARRIIEEIILEGLRDWTRKIGLGSYNKIEIRSDPNSKRSVGPFKWDLTAPSYIFPFKNKGDKPGFIVADVFAEAVINEHSVKYIARKASLTSAALRHVKILPLLVASGFEGTALTKGRSEGMILATPETIFGKSTAKGIQNLLDTLKNAAATAAANPKKLLLLIDQLKDIEGSVGNLRGILFELITARLAKAQGGSIEFGISARGDTPEKKADIDVLRIVNKAECILIECKGKNPGNRVSKEEIEDWLRRLPIFLHHVRQNMNFSEAKVSYEFWTTSDFNEDALQLLEAEKFKRTKCPISWRNGKDVIAISKSLKETAISKALNEHFIKHPLA